MQRRKMAKPLQLMKQYKWIQLLGIVQMDTPRNLEPNAILECQIGNVSNFEWQIACIDAGREIKRSGNCDPEQNDHVYSSTALTTIGRLSCRLPPDGNGSARTPSRWRFGAIHFFCRISESPVMDKRSPLKGGFF
jgi:hypothetical protein